MGQNLKTQTILLICLYGFIVIMLPSWSWQSLMHQTIDFDEAWLIWLDLISHLDWISGEDKLLVFKGFLFIIFPILIPSALLYVYLEVVKIRKQTLVDLKTRAEFAPISSLKSWMGYPGLQLTKNIRIFCKRCAEHLLILGPTGSGKSAAFFIPNLVSTDAESSFVVTDPKGELYQKTYDYLAGLGKDVLFFKPDKAEHSLCWNPLALPETPSDIEKTCNSVVANGNSSDDQQGGSSDPFWEESAKDLLSGYVYIVKALSCVGKKFPRIEEIKESLGSPYDKLDTEVRFSQAVPGCHYYEKLSRRELEKRFSKRLHNRFTKIYEAYSKSTDPFKKYLADSCQRILNLLKKEKESQILQYIEKNVDEGFTKADLCAIEILKSEINSVWQRVQSSLKCCHHRIGGRKCEEIRDCQNRKNYVANFANIHALLTSASFEGAIGLSYFASAILGYDEPYLKMKAFDVEQSPSDTRNSTKTVLTVSLKAFTERSVKQVTAINQIEFGALKEKPVALFVSVPEHKSQVFQPIMSTFYMQAVDFLLEKGAGGRYVYFLLDEFANIGKIIGFEKYVATVRSRNISVACGLQSIEQLTRVYGDAQKKEILNNLKIKLVFPGLSEAEALEYLNKIAGQTAIYVKRNLKAEEGEVVDKEVLPIRAIRELKDDYDNKIHEAIVLIGNEKPVKDLQERYYLNKKYLKRTLNEKELPKVDLSFTDRHIYVLEELIALDLAGVYLYTHGGTKMVSQEISDQVDPKVRTLEKLLSHRPSGPQDWIEYLIKREVELKKEQREILLKKKKDFFKAFKDLSAKEKNEKVDNEFRERLTTECRAIEETYQVDLSKITRALTVIKVARPAIFWCYNKGIFS